MSNKLNKLASVISKLENEKKHLWKQHCDIEDTIEQINQQLDELHIEMDVEYDRVNKSK